LISVNVWHFCWQRLFPWLVPETSKKPVDKRLALPARPGSPLLQGVSVYVIRHNRRHDRRLAGSVPAIRVLGIAQAARPANALPPPMR
jgi:hypothetical protein